MAAAARRWIEPFREALPDVHMDIVILVAEGTPSPDASVLSLPSGAVARAPADGPEFRNVDDVYFFTIREGRIASTWGLEDNDRRRRELGI